MKELLLTDGDPSSSSLSCTNNNNTAEVKHLTQILGKDA